MSMKLYTFENRRMKYDSHGFVVEVSIAARDRDMADRILWENGMPMSDDFMTHREMDTTLSEGVVEVYVVQTDIVKKVYLKGGK